ncbi:hypothetical protein BAY59_38345 [Prauserella coralliicola]|uniref:Uncharacterized protein n=1 Tax=Prauserella flavalba TaxID=1477506 RepID=A0A318LBP5_9PSEU|nr:hypothetical protein BAY59_38345 [Prauserella coralliicola]PXY16889.1 hypothetical protein BA062_38325 [Prauserella flavalba]
MELSRWLLRTMPPRPLVVTVPGGTEARLAVERCVRERAWGTAFSPAEANILVVAGVAGHALEPLVEQLWGLIPAPRTRVDVQAANDAPRELDVAVSALHNVDYQHKQATEALSAGDRPESEAGRQEHGSHAEHRSHHSAPSGSGHAEQDQQQHGHHEHHGHHGHDMDGMQLAGGVPMAGRADDRDGLTLDQLHVPLGPLLPLWPPGLVVRTKLQGDVIQQAAVEVLGIGDARGDAFWLRPGRPLKARWLDASAALLAIAGWADAAAVARRLRDQVLTGTPQAEIAGPIRRWGRQVRRSRTLPWLLTGVGQVPDKPSTPRALAGDALTRLYRWVDSLADPKTSVASPDVADGTPWAVDVLPSVLEGRELATARLIVASLDLDTDMLTVREAHHG